MFLFLNRSQSRDTGRLLSIIILAEGAQNIRGEPVTADQVKNVCDNYLGESFRYIYIIMLFPSMIFVNAFEQK